MPSCPTQRSAPNTMRADLTAVAGFTQEDLFSGINFEDIFGGLNFSFDFGGGNPFEGFFHRRSKGPVRGANIEMELSIPLERVANGGEEKSG